MKNSKVKRATEIQDSIRQVLFLYWDPFNVNDNPKLQDEYNSYIAPIYRILVGSRSEDEPILYLYQTESQTPDMSCDSRKRLRPVARRLLELDVKL
jgi:hypothetical protein